MLKEFGKDLWKATKQLILSKREQKTKCPKVHKDRIRLEMRISDFSMTTVLLNIGKGSEEEVKKFLESDLNKMYNAYTENKCSE